MVRQCQKCRKLDFLNPNISFHKFPTDPKRRKVWLDILGCESKIVPKFSDVCSDHFEEKDFAYNTRGNRVLMKEAVPRIQASESTYIPCVRLQYQIVDQSTQSEVKTEDTETAPITEAAQTENIGEGDGWIIQSDLDIIDQPNENRSEPFVTEIKTEDETEHFKVENELIPNDWKTRPAEVYIKMKVEKGLEQVVTEVKSEKDRDITGREWIDMQGEVDIKTEVDNRLEQDVTRVKSETDRYIITEDEWNDMQGEVHIKTEEETSVDDSPNDLPKIGEHQPAINEEGTMSVFANGSCHSSLKYNEVPALVSIKTLAPTQAWYKSKDQAIHINNLEMADSSSRNSLVQQATYRCTECDFLTCSETSFQNHQLCHKRREEVELFKCSLCSYQTCWKGDLNRHELLHKHPDQIERFKCDECDFVTNQKHCLKTHLLRHTSSEVVDYQTGFGSNLMKPMVSPKNIDEVKMYHCPDCDYKSRYKSHLRKHFLRRQDPKDVEMYRCFQCDYQTSDKGCLKRHVFVHKSESEVEMNFCTQCGYKAKFKSYLARHLLRRHNDAAEMIVHKCNRCEFVTKFKRSLSDHVVYLHEGSDLFKCAQCDYQTMYKSALVSHMFTHRNVSESEMHACPECDYKAKLKRNLTKHLQRHENRKKRTVFKCNKCDFQTLRKQSWSVHVLHRHEC